MTFNYLSFSGAVTFILCSYSAAIVFVKNKSKSIQYTWGLFSLFIALWGFGLFFAFSFLNKEIVLFWCRFLNIVAILIPAFYIHFVFCFLNIEKSKQKLIYFTYATGILYGAACVAFPQYFLVSVTPKYWFDLYPVPGILYYFFPLFFGIEVSIGVLHLVRQLKYAEGKEKNQILYLSLATAIGLFGGGTTFFLVFNIPIYPFGALGLLFMVSIITFAITKHELMDIRLVITKTGAIMTAGAGVIASAGLFFFTRDSVILTCGLAVALMMVWAFLGTKVIGFIQTGLEKKFIASEIKLDDVIKTVSVKLVHIDTKESVMTLLASELMTQFSAGFAISLLKTQDMYDGFLFTHQTQKPMSFEFEHPLIQSVLKSPELQPAPELTHYIKNDVDFLQLPDLSKTIFIPIHADDEIQGIIILGPLLNENSYHNPDLAIISAVVNQTTIIFQRILKDQQLKDLNQTLEEKVQIQAGEIERAREFTQKSEEQMSFMTLTKGIAHEIRNPMSIIRSNAELMHSRADKPDKVRQFATVAMAHIDRVLAITESMTNWADVSEMTPSMIDIHDQIQSVIALFSDRASQVGITISEVPSQIGPVSADPTAIYQILFNLTNNAIDAMSDAGATGDIVIATTTKTTRIEGISTECVAISITDSGPGIPENIKAKLFDSFFTTKHTHMGLGLSLVARLVHAHRGIIEIDNRSDGGTGAIFTVLLPR